MSKMGVSAVALVLCGVAWPAAAGSDTHPLRGDAEVAHAGVIAALRSAPAARGRRGSFLERRALPSAAPDEQAFSRLLLHPEVTATSLEPQTGDEAWPHVRGGVHATQAEVRD